MIAAELVTAALAGVASTIEPLGSEHWSFTLEVPLPAARAVALQARAYLDDAWLVLEARRSAAPCPWSLLEWNQTLPAGVRLALSSVPSVVLLRADVACDPDAALGDRVVAAGAGLQVAARCLAGAGAPLPPDIPGERAAPSHVAALCRDTGFAVHERPGGAVVVDLDVPGAFHQAMLAPGPDGGIVAAVPVLEAALDATDAFAVRRRAVARLLLRLGGMIRSVRAVATVGEPAAPGFQVVVAADGAALAFGLGALALACRLGAVAATVIAHDDAAATLYLQHSGAPAIRAAA